MTGWLLNVNLTSRGRARKKYTYGLMVRTLEADAGRSATLRQDDRARGGPRGVRPGVLPLKKHKGRGPKRPRLRRVS